jgi:hypothetical protein
MVLREPALAALLATALVVSCEKSMSDAKRVAQYGSDSGTSAADCRARAQVLEQERKYDVPRMPVRYVEPGDGVDRFCVGDLQSAEPLRDCVQAGGVSRCRDFHRAMDREYQAGRLVEIRIHRSGRASGRTGRNVDGSTGVLPFPNVWSVTKSAIQTGGAPHAVLERLGKPQRAERFMDPEFGEQSLYYFPGLVVEVESGAGGRPVVGGIRIVRGSPE